MGEPKIIFITGTSRGLGATLLAQLRVAVLRGVLREQTCDKLK